MIFRIKNFIKSRLRSWYENQVNLSHGRLKFIGAICFCQLTPEEFIRLNPPSGNVGEVLVTTNDMRPMLSFKYWPSGMEWKEDMPLMHVIVEEKRFQVRVGDSALWDVADFKHPVIRELAPLFLASAFYTNIRSEHKKKKDVEATS